MVGHLVVCIPEVEYEALVFFCIDFIARILYSLIVNVMFGLLRLWIVEQVNLDAND